MARLNLKAKYKIEKEFHDKWAESVELDEVDTNESFESITAIENRFINNLIQPISGKKILDLGCGIGDATLYFADKGARVYSVDISPGMVSLVKRFVKKHKFQKLVTVKVMVAEKLKFKDNFFDVVYGNGILHHADPNQALQEVQRVLKQGGKAYFIEPLAHNPAINVYRKLASGVRTPTEVPLSYNKLKYLTVTKFRKFYHQEFQLLTLLIFVWYFLGERINPNHQRYWKKLLKDDSRLGRVFLLLSKFDNMLFFVLPFLKRFCWNTLLVYEK